MCNPLRLDAVGVQRGVVAVVKEERGMDKENKNKERSGKGPSSVMGSRVDGGANSLCRNQSPSLTTNRPTDARQPTIVPDHRRRTGQSNASPASAMPEPRPSPRPRVHYSHRLYFLLSI